jgi:hypothetical protein
VKKRREERRDKGRKKCREIMKEQSSRMVPQFVIS